MPKQSADLLNGREPLLVLLLAVFAALRVFLIAAALPFFTNLDEHQHADLVVRAAAGDLPVRTSAYAPESARLFVLHGSPEYYLPPLEALPEPPWTLPDIEAHPAFRRGVERWEKGVNWEAFTPPAYYVAQGAWSLLGRTFSQRDGLSLYWARFLNALILAAFVIVAWACLGRLLPDEPFVRLAVPTLAAAFPQQAFFSINPDALSALLGALAFWALAEVARAERPSARLLAAAGAAVAAAFLCKYSNVAFAGALAFVAWRGRRHAAGVALMLAAAALPVLAWCARNKTVLGNWTGTAEKTRLLTWTLKSPSAWLEHPFFTLSGAASFFHELIRSFWSGELLWRGSRLASPSADTILVAATAALMAVAIARARRDETNRLAALVVVVTTAFLLAVSLAFDFGDSPNPSRAHPFLSSGRLAMGALLPFLLLLARGLDAFPAKRTAVRTPLLVGLVLLAAGHQFFLYAPAFMSRYNWYHLIGP